MSAFPIFPRCHPPLPIPPTVGEASPQDFLPRRCNGAAIQTAARRHRQYKNTTYEHRYFAKTAINATKRHHANDTATPLKKHFADVAVFAIFRQMAALILQTQTNKTYEQQKSTILKNRGLESIPNPDIIGNIAIISQRCSYRQSTPSRWFRPGE